MTKLFPTVHVPRGGDEARFYIDYKLVRVPLRFGSGDMCLHVIPWLFRYWPFIRNNGRLVKVMPDGEYRNLAKEFAEVKYRGLDYDFENIKAVDGNWLNWTGDNILPDRNPNAPATDNEKKNEVHRRLWAVKVVGQTLNGQRVPSELDFMTRTLSDLRRAVAATVHAYDSILTTDQSIGINTDLSTTLAEWERNVVADFTVGNAETKNREQHDEDQLFDDPSAWMTKDEKPARSSRISNMDGDDPENGEEIATAPTKRVIRYETQPPVPTPYETVEQVLNHFGWVTPENGHKPTYEGRDSKKVWLHTRPVVFSPRTIHVAHVPDDLKFCWPSKALPVREVSIGDFVPSRPIKTCRCAICMAPRQPRKNTLVTVLDDYGIPITVPIKKAKRYLKANKLGV
jgi:hypothetical protein